MTELPIPPLVGRPPLTLEAWLYVRELIWSVQYRFVCTAISYCYRLDMISEEEADTGRNFIVKCIGGNHTYREWAQEQAPEAYGSFTSLSDIDNAERLARLQWIDNIIEEVSKCNISE